MSKRTTRHGIFRSRVFSGALGHGFCGDFECKTRAERAFLLQNCGEQGTQNIEPAVTISYLIQRERILRWPRDSIMLGVTIQDLGEMAVIRCVGRIVAGREANTLREAVLSQPKRRAVVLDLTGVDVVDGGGMGMLVFLQGWTRTVGIDLQLLNPALQVRECEQCKSGVP